jgi:flagellar biosynthesis/type III secretory pathway protein FliH
MDNIGIIFILFAVVLPIIAISAVVIGYLWGSSKTKSALLKQLKEQGDAMDKELQEQLQDWKDQELTEVLQQAYDAAKDQATQEMQEEMRYWQETELRQLRKQIYAVKDLYPFSDDGTVTQAKCQLIPRIMSPRI